MPFIKLEDHYAFLHHDNYMKLNEIALKDKDASWRIGSAIHGRKEAEEASILRSKTLTEIYRNTNFDDFYDEWIRFNLEGMETIRHELPYLLYDYGCVNQYFGYKKVSMRLEEYLFLDLQYDVQADYQLYTFSYAKKLFSNKTQVTFSTLINTEDIEFICGELNKFTIKLPSFHITFGEDLVILPNGAKRFNKAQLY
jgi:hypothetical protein